MLLICRPRSCRARRCSPRERTATLSPAAAKRPPKYPPTPPAPAMATLRGSIYSALRTAPPSNMRAWPWMKEAAGEASQATVLPNSSTLPIRPRGTSSANRHFFLRCRLAQSLRSRRNQGNLVLSSEVHRVALGERPSGDLVDARRASSSQRSALRGGCGGRSLGYPLTAPNVKPATNRSRKRLYTMPTGRATRAEPAIRDCQKKTSPRINSVGTPTLIVRCADDETNARA